MNTKCFKLLSVVAILMAGDASAAFRLNHDLLTKAKSIPAQTTSDSLDDNSSHEDERVLEEEGSDDAIDGHDNDRIDRTGHSVVNLSPISEKGNLVMKSVLGQVRNNRGNPAIVDLLNAWSMARPELSGELQNALVTNLVDYNRDGNISAAEFHVHRSILDLFKEMWKPSGGNMTRTEFFDGLLAMGGIDTNSDGALSEDELKRAKSFTTRLIEVADQGVTKEEWNNAMFSSKEDRHGESFALRFAPIKDYIFPMFDNDHDNVLNETELARVFHHIFNTIHIAAVSDLLSPGNGYGIAARALGMMYKIADKNRDGNISRTEFDSLESTFDNGFKEIDQDGNDVEEDNDSDIDYIDRALEANGAFVLISDSSDVEEA